MPLSKYARRLAEAVAFQALAGIYTLFHTGRSK
ncbi:Uncharacterised protein [Vibrio cholerae]|nr:Uncharacterised protein [Vibrio cholerae]CSI66283.1 Uncharacterised protein [Vibrio cholerae]